MGYPSIVKLNVSETQASAPSLLQETGAAVSQGATTLANGKYSLLTSAASLTPLLAAPLAITSVSWSAGVATADTEAVIPGLSVGDVFITTVAGVLPAGYNGLVLGTVTGANSFTYSVANNPGAQTQAGTYTPPNQAELQAMVNTFFAQGSGTSLYVLELGAGNGTSGPPLLQSFEQANPNLFYGYLIPRLWDAKAAFLAMVANFEALNSQTYFYVTTTTGNYSQYTPAMKCVLAMVEAPNLPLTEFSMAAEFQHNLSYAPTSTNKMTPNAFAYLDGVTAYPEQGNGTLLQELLTAGVNFVGTGAEGGISNTLIMNGTTMDGNDFAWWYSADYMQIQGDRAVAAAVINGSNNPLAPLYYNQAGINTLQDTLFEVVQQAVGAGLAAGSVVQTALDPATFEANLEAGVYAGMNVVNAVPFSTYVQQNPNDYGKKKYGGLSVVYLPQNGFTQVVININVSNLIGSV